MGTPHEYQIFPNPNNGAFIIQQTAAENGPVTVSIYDMLGKIVHTDMHTFSGQQLRLKLNAPSEAYIVSIENKEHVRSHFKLQIQ